MKKHYTDSAGVPHRSMTEEWLCHHRGSEWWYCTGILHDGQNRMYSFQFTLIKPHVLGLKAYVLMLALTDFSTGQHEYIQKAIFDIRKIVITDKRVGIKGIAMIDKLNDEIHLQIHTNKFCLALHMKSQKPPVWHCDGGILKMGLDLPRETTYYYSYTNLAVSGELTIGTDKKPVAGKAWFDKQGGLFSMLDGRTHWEWFSLRFFDNEEIMLFSFPQNDFLDGTFIDKAGQALRLNHYSVEPTRFIEANGMKFSSRWQVTLPGIKQEHYEIVPILEEQLNLVYFELLAEVFNARQEKVGFCFVELLPGVYNKKYKIFVI